MTQQPCVAVSRAWQRGEVPLAAILWLAQARFHRPVPIQVTVQWRRRGRIQVIEKEKAEPGTVQMRGLYGVKRLPRDPEHKPVHSFRPRRIQLEFVDRG